jgi:hypothetical protein
MSLLRFYLIPSKLDISHTTLERQIDSVIDVGVGRKKRGFYRNGCKTKVALPKISVSRESTPIGATKNNWNRNFRSAMITIITTMIMIM